MWPSPRRCVGIAPSAAGMYVWGGSGITSDGARYTFLNDWWELNSGTASWSMLQDTDDHLQSPRPDSLQPGPRYTPVFETIGAEVFLFGGYTEDRLGKRKLNDAWIHDGTRWSSVAIQGGEGYSAGAGWPGVRYGCMSASTGDAVFVCGGFSDDGDHNDLWRFDLASRRWRLIEGDQASDAAPAARYCAAFAHDRGRLFMFGGRSRKRPRFFDRVKRPWNKRLRRSTTHWATRCALLVFFDGANGTHLAIGEGRHQETATRRRNDATRGRT